MIIGQYMIESDDNNVTLYKSHIITKCKGGIQPKAENIGKDKWERIGYYSSLATALQGMVNHGIDDSGMKTVELLAAKMNELLAAINSATGSAIARINVAPPVSTNPMDDTAEGNNPPETVDPYPDAPNISENAPVELNPRDTTADDFNPPKINNNVPIKRGRGRPRKVQA